MPIQPDQIKAIASLARLALDDAEIQTTANKLSNIITLVDRMQAVDTRAVAPMAHPLAAGLRLREDIVTEQNLREQLQSVAPSTEDGLYLVPKVIE